MLCWICLKIEIRWFWSNDKSVVSFLWCGLYFNRFCSADLIIYGLRKPDHGNMHVSLGNFLVKPSIVFLIALKSPSDSKGDSFLTISVPPSAALIVLATPSLSIPSCCFPTSYSVYIAAFNPSRGLQGRYLGLAVSVARSSIRPHFQTNSSVSKTALPI